MWDKAWAMNGSRLCIAAVGALAFGLATGCATMRDHQALVARTDQLEKDLEKSRADLAAARADLDATRQRLDNALRASADSSIDLVASKQRVNDLAGKVDEATHGVEELRRDLGATRTELYARLDDVKRIATQPSAPAAKVAVPEDRVAHMKAIEDAHARRDWATVRAFGPEYVNRYPTDEKADEALYYLGNADLQDGRPSSALGHYNRVLKLFPRSNVLDKTLFDIGEAYLLMHDCGNAKVAFEACDKRYAKEKIGELSRAKLALIAKSPAGMCAPQ